MTRSPTTFFRYRAFSTATLEALCHDRLYFANPGTFNDPLDCSPTVECDSDLVELRTLLSMLVQRRVRAEVLASLKQARLKGEGVAAHAERRALSEARSELANIAYLATNPDYEISEVEAERWLLTSEIQRELLRHYERGVCCFSTSYRSPLLWSHYGDQHRGLCIGYGLERRPRPQLKKVAYRGKRSVTTSLLLAALVRDVPDAVEELDRSVLLRKAPGWRYENEWRLIDAQGEQDSPLLLKEITFGLRCPTAVVHAVMRALEGRDTQLRYFQIHDVKGSFALRRSEVEQNEVSMYLPNTARSGIEVFGNPEEL